jgi:hypothetical protein
MTPTRVLCTGRRGLTKVNAGCVLRKRLIVAIQPRTAGTERAAEALEIARNTTGDPALREIPCRAADGIRIPRQRALLTSR